jgi:hypothetical protein
LLPRQSDFAFRAADCRSPPVPEFLYTHNKKRKRNTKVLASSTTQQTHTQTFFWKRKKRRRRGKMGFENRMQGGLRAERHTLPLHLQKEKTARRSIREK